MWKVISGAALAIAAVAAPFALDRTATGALPDPGFRRGVNVLGYDPYWKNPAKARFERKHFAEIRRGGFDFVRVNMVIFDRMNAEGQIDPDWLRRLDWVVDNATRAGLGVILDEHDFGACARDVALCRIKLPAIWQQLASRYKGAPANVAFELLNEPNGHLDADTWNAMVAELLPIVRATNPSRTVIIGPTKWYSLKLLPQLRLPPDDQHILVTFHYYGPFRFTHQGAKWTNLKDLRGVTWGNTEDRRAIKHDFDRVSAWARANRRPILLGEFGAYDQGGIPIAMRADYVGTLACQAEAHGFGWAYWQFDGNFIVWDMKADGWVKPIRDALIPPSGRPRRC